MALQNVHYETNGKRAFLALLTGTVVAALAVVVIPYLIDILTNEDWDYFVAYGFENTIVVFVVANIFSFAFLCLVGVPVWLLAHAHGWVRWWHAISFGAASAFVAVLLLETNLLTGRSFSEISYSEGDRALWKDGILTADGWSNALDTAFLSAVVGVIVALVVWRIAYRKIGSLS